MTGISPLRLFIVIALAAALVVLPMGCILMPLPWMIFVALAWRQEAKRGRGASAIITYVLVTASIVVAALLAPVKTTEQVLDRSFMLPDTELTLGEMDRSQNFDQAQWMPLYIHIASTPENADDKIRFRAKEITLREYVDTIESQSKLRHRFMHCGNGSSILFGGDCSFGVLLR